MNWLAHICIIGQPRTGKTTLAVGMFHSGNPAIFCNVANEPYFGDYPYVTRNAQEAVQVATQGGTIVYNCSYWEVEALCKLLIATQMRLTTRHPITVYIDEGHLIAPRGSVSMIQGEAPNTFTFLLTNGLRYNIRTVWITQRPQLLDPSIYRLCQYHIIFKLDYHDINYLQRSGVPVPDEPLARYDWVIV